MRQRVLIQQPIETRSPSGAIKRTWETIGQWWVEITPIRGREFFHAGQIKGDITHRVRGRYDSRITRAHRLIIGQREDGRILHIVSALNVDERKRELELMCKEGAFQLQRATA